MARKVNHLLHLPILLLFLTQIERSVSYVDNTNLNTATKCFNPNGRQGYCIPINECQSLQYPLKHKDERCYKFIKRSQCDCDSYASKEASPYVCCTPDIDFSDKALERRHRIIFPTDEILKTATEAATTSSTEVTSSEMPTAQKVEFYRPPDCGEITIAKRIYGGSEAELTEFSWMVNLMYRSSKGELASDCAGSLINERYILTAAHCVTGKIEQKVGKLEFIVVGDHNTKTEVDCNSDNLCTRPPQNVGIESIVVHQQFDFDKDLGIHQHNDIALIRMDRSIAFDSAIQPVCLPLQIPSMELRSGMKLTVAGWGHNGTVKRTAEKRKVRVPFVDTGDCRKEYKTRYVADEQLCAGGVYKEDSCLGDSGGPLMRLDLGSWFLEGIVSFGINCGLEDKPGLYTRVRSYLDWIEENVHV